MLISFEAVKNKISCLAFGWFWWRRSGQPAILCRFGQTRVNGHGFPVHDHGFVALHVIGSDG